MHTSDNNIELLFVIEDATGLANKESRDLAEGIGFYLILLGLGVAPGVGTLSIAIFVLSFSTVIGAISALPGGLLATDASIVGMLVLLLDMDANTAAAATLLIRFATLWFGVGIGFITWFFSRDLLSMRINKGEILDSSVK